MQNTSFRVSIALCCKHVDHGTSYEITAVRRQHTARGCVATHWLLKPGATVGPYLKKGTYYMSYARKFYRRYTRRRYSSALPCPDLRYQHRDQSAEQGRAWQQCVRRQHSVAPPKCTHGRCTEPVSRAEEQLRQLLPLVVLLIVLGL